MEKVLHEKYKEYFAESKANDSHVVIADVGKNPIEYEGHVNVMLQSGKKNNNAILMDVEYVSEIAVNLVAVK